MNMYTEPCFVPNGLTKEELLRYRKKVFKEFYLRPRIIISYPGLVKNPTHVLKLYKGSKALLKFWINKNKKSEGCRVNGPFGSILKYALPITVSTADGITKRLDNNFISRAGLRFIGLPHLGLIMRYRKIFRSLSLNKEDSLLDIGCGIGLYPLSLANRVKSAQGVDLDYDKIKIAKKIAESLKVRNINFKVADINRLPFPDNVFDKVLCSEVIEHIVDDRRAVSELTRVLKKGGNIILTTTSKNSLIAHKKKDFGHVRVGYSLIELKSLFEQGGVKIQKIEPYGLFFGRLAWNLNRLCFRHIFLTALTFYPLLFLSMLDNLMPEKEDRNCLGYIVCLKKTDA